MDGMSMEQFFYRLDCLVGDAEDSSEIYMPGLATALRVKADEMAELYPDDANRAADASPAPTGGRE